MSERECLWRNKDGVDASKKTRVSDAIDVFFFVFPFSSLMWPTIPQASFSVPRASVSASQIQLLISVWCLSHTKFKQKYLDTLNKYATHNSQFKRRVYYNICTELYMCCILEWNGARMEN